MVLSATRQHVCRQFRTFSSSARRLQAATAKDAAARMLEQFANTSITRRQLIDANQLQKLSLTLGRTSIQGADIVESPPPAGTPVPPGHHLVYFTPNGLESELGPDGTDKTFNAQAPFSRRMWAGGRMTWPAGSSSAWLRVGDEVEERTRLLSAVAKQSRSAGEMVLVEVEKEIWGPRGLAVVDQRSWVFRPELDASAILEKQGNKSPGVGFQGVSQIQDVDGENGIPSRQFQWSPVALFRFSALTFNGHKIHYNEPWTRDIEGHPGAVVHGPLNLISILDYWRDIHGKGGFGPNTISYRALSPIYAGDRYSIQTKGVEEVNDAKVWQIVAEKDGITSVKAEIQSS